VIARWGYVNRHQTIAQIDQPGTRVFVNPGGTNERFAKRSVKNAAKPYTLRRIGNIFQAHLSN